MHTLAWFDPAGNLAAYGQAPASISDVLKFKAMELPITIWPMPRWTYTHRLASLIDIYPINAVMPAYLLEVDGTKRGGSSLFLTGPSELGRIASPSFTRVAAFHIEDFFGIQSVSIPELLLALPDLIVRNKERMKALHVDSPQEG